MKAYYLEPKLDNRKSFYKKAVVIKDGETIKLESYNTIVAEYNPLKRRMQINGYYSPTTARHIREFCYQFAKPRPSKSEMESRIVYE